MISVVILNYHAPGIEKCLRSLDDQSVEPHEVIEIKDADSQALCRNRGASKATGDVVAFLDSDCMAPRRWIERIEENYSKGIKAMGGPYIPSQRTDFARDAHRYIARVAGWRSATFADRRGEVREMPSLSGGDSAFDLDLFRSVGGYDERQHWREEPELCRKVKAAGAPLMFDPEMWVWHEWRGWNSLWDLAKAGHYYGRIKVWSDREIEP